MTAINGESWRPWLVGDVPAGYVTVYDNPTGPANFTFITVKVRHSSLSLSLSLSLSCARARALALPLDPGAALRIRLPRGAVRRTPGTWFPSTSRSVRSRSSGDSSKAALSKLSDSKSTE